MSSEQDPTGMGRWSEITFAGKRNTKISKQEAKNYPGLPGTNGPNPKTSTGAKHLNIHREPSFIDMTGKQSMLLDNGCWELVWRDGSSAGNLICGLESPNTYQRNDATLPQGRLYLSFLVWTKETLAKAQTYKAEAEVRAKKYLHDKMDFLHKYEAEPNIFKKVMHYRKALEAAELFSLTKTYEHVPLDSDTMVLQDDLILTTKGTVSSKQNVGGMFSHLGHTQLGTATISPVLEEVDVDTKKELRP
jgi:hypothetical protein